MAQSLLRRMKRKAKQRQGLRFTDRAFESIRTGKPITRIDYEVEGAGSNAHLVAREVK